MIKIIIGIAFTVFFLICFIDAVKEKRKIAMVLWFLPLAFNLTCFSLSAYLHFVRD